MIKLIINTIQLNLYSTKQTEKNMQENVKECITQSLILLLKHTPYEKITMDMISSKSGFSRRTIYRYFKCKQDILNEWINMLIEMYNEYLESSLKNHDNAILASFEFLYNNSEFFKIFYNNNMLDSISFAIEGIVSKILNYRHDDISTWNELYTKYYTSFIAGGFYKVLYEWLNSDDKRSAYEMYEIYKSVISDLAKRISDL